MYRVSPPFWFRARDGKIYVSSCASELSISGAEELLEVLRGVIDAAKAQESEGAQAPLSGLPAAPAIALCERGGCAHGPVVTGVVCPCACHRHCAPCDEFSMRQGGAIALDGHLSTGCVLVCPMQRARIQGEAAELAAIDRKREAAGDDE